jgi:hypothetical protein
VLRLAALHSITSAKAQVEADAPTTVNSSVRNTRKYLTPAEVERLMAAQPMTAAPPRSVMNSRRL